MPCRVDPKPFSSVDAGVARNDGNRTVNERRSATPVRLTLASVLGDELCGAWWPRSASIAAELPGLAEVLRDRLGQVVDIQVSWSSVDGVPDLDLLTRRGVSAMPGLRTRPQRVMSVTGSDATVKLIVVPHHTTSPLAVLVMRHAAGLPVDARHHESDAYRAADDIVRSAQAQCTRWKN